MNVRAQKFEQSTVLSWPLPTSWWVTEFEEATQGGVKPYLFKGILPNDFPDADEINRGLRAIQRSSAAKNARVRVYLGEERRDDLVKKVLETPLTTDEPLPSYMARLTGEERFSLIINSFQDWSDSLTAHIGNFLQSMFRARGIPLGGTEQVVFAGNYAGTAFGVHRGFEHAFLIHLGPGVKDFYCWSEQSYLELTGSLNPTFGDYGWLLPHATKFVLEPGDALYLPALVFHVGLQDTFSASVACPLYTYPFNRLLRQTISSLAELIPFEEEGFSPHQAFSFDTNPLVESAMPIVREILSDWVRTKIPTVLHYQWFRLVSNGGFDISESSVDDAGEEIGLCAPLDLDRKSILRLRSPYMICSTTKYCEPGKIQVFLRGRCVVVEASEELAPLFESLNSGAEVGLAQCGEGVLAAFQQISRTNGLELVAIPAASTRKSGD